MSECTCPCPTCDDACDDEHSATLMELDEARHMQRSLECELSATRAALDAAQDEIERLIGELAEKRIQIEVLEARPPLVRVVDIRDEGSCVVAEGSHWHVDGGGS